MMDNGPDYREPRVSGGTSWWAPCGVLGGVCALVIGVYVVAARSGVMESMSPDAADTYYNLLVQGFRAGHLSLKKEPPPGLAQLADPYDPVANARYRPVSDPMVDLSYYSGRLYLYFGVTPVVLLFWPFAALTGHYLFHRQGVVIFCSLGFLASMGLLHALWRRYFAEVRVGVVAACALALGLATGVPVLLSRSEVYEVPISCGYMLTMLALGALWRALHEPDRGWPRKLLGLALASAAYGLAVGARPNLLFGAVILLVPVARAWRERRPIGALLTAATGPIALIGLGLMLYNALRFDHPFEFGGRYQLGPGRQDTVQYFSLGYLWYNFRVYFLEPLRWSRHFPFVYGIVAPPVPPGHNGNLQESFGVLSNIPLVWLALTATLARRGRSPRLSESGSILGWFVAAVAMLAGTCALTLCLFFSVAMRHEVDFLPALVLLAVVGILGLEQDRLVWRQAVRWGWGVLLGFSVAVNLLAGVENYGKSYCYMGNALCRAGKLEEAIGCYERALRIVPDYVEAHNNLGLALAQTGKLKDAIGHYERAVRIRPDYAEAHNNLGLALAQTGEFDEAIRQYEQALQIAPDLAETHNNLGVALAQTGRPQDAIGHYEQALQIMPEFARAHNNLGVALQQAGRVEDAISHYEQAVRIKPDYAEAHYDLGVALEQVGRVQEAIGHYRQALRIKPDHREAQRRLARLPVVQ